MASRQPIRVLGLTPKLEAKPLPRVPCDWKLVVDLDGAAKIYLEFWKKTLLGKRQDGRITRRGLEALSADYFLKTETVEIPKVDLPNAYTCVLSNDRLPLACATLLQLGIKARIVLLVEQRGRKSSFALATDRPAVHVLRQFFRELQLISVEQFARVESGSHVKPRQLRRFKLPVLPGVSTPVPLPVSVPSNTPTDDAIFMGTYLSASGAAVGRAWLSLSTLNRHLFVVGTTGSGKTNTVMKLVNETQGKLRGILIFDIKREYRSLQKTIGAKVYNFDGPGVFTHNLLKPEGKPERWVKEFARIFAEVISRHVPATGTGDLVAEELDRLYRERGVYDGSADYPHVGDLLEAMEKRGEEPGASRERNWLSSGLRVLRTLRIGSTKKAFFVREGLALDRLLEGVNVVELDGIGDPTATGLLISVLLQKIRHRLEAQEQSDLRNIIVVEEAQHVLARGSESTSVLTDTCREIRSYGVGLVFVTQLPSEFSKHAIANVNTLIIHKLVHPEDKRFAASLLGLEDDAKELVERLDLGQAFVRTDVLALARMDKVERPNVRDDELSQTIPNREEIASDFAQRREAQNRAEDLAPKDWEVFVAVAEARAVYTRAVADALHRSRQDVTGSLRNLVARGLLRYKEARREQGGRPPTIYFPTPMGEEAYRARTGHYPDRVVGAADHKELVQNVVDALGVVRKPHPRFDILYAENGDQRAVEVETGANHNAQLRENLTKSLAFQREARFVVADQVTYNRVLQVAARLSFDTGQSVVLRVATKEGAAARKWDSYLFGRRGTSTL